MALDMKRKLLVCRRPLEQWLANLILEKCMNLEKQRGGNDTVGQLIRNILTQSYYVTSERLRSTASMTIAPNTGKHAE